MERIEAMVPPPMEKNIETFQEREGFENKSQAIRELLRRGLNDGRDCVHPSVGLDGRGEV